MIESSRQAEFEKSHSSESFVERLNEVIGIGEHQAASLISPHPPGPTFLVIGAPRSGTTLLMQWCSKWDGLTVPTNLLARFYATPYIGALIQQLLTTPELSYRDELSTHKPPSDSFKSVVGKTDGLLEPHEFFYFWRRFFPLDFGRSMTENERTESDPAGFRQAVAQLHQGLGCGLAMKAILLQYELALVAEALPECVFLNTVRDEVENCASLLAARQTVYGSENEWFSVMPPGAERYKDADPITQVAAQVALTNDRLSEQLADLPVKQSIVVDHERFCEDPSYVGNEMMSRLRDTPYSDAHPDSELLFTPHRRKPERASEISDALERVRSENLSE